MQWFDVDKEGLAKILERKGKSFVVYELLQNAWDQDVSTVSATLEPLENRPVCRLRVQDDDPDGFQDLSHAYTLFAESMKKSDPEKRGRFNLGEKLVLALCNTAKIKTTKGSVIFDKSGRRKSREKTEKGSEFEAEIRMTRGEFEEVCRDIRWHLIVPEDITTVFNGQTLKAPKPVACFEAQLPTEIMDAEGRLKRTKRVTAVSVYEPSRPGECSGWLYEMGIPVVETGDRFDVDVSQKIPINLDRDNVSPSYLKAIRTFVLNHTYDLLQTQEEATESWVREALADERVEEDAFKKTTELRFGSKSVVYDPSDPEANNIAVSKGYSVISGGSMSGGEWENNRRFGSVAPAGQVTPSPRVNTSPDGRPWNVVDPSKHTKGMKQVVRLTERIAHHLLGEAIQVDIVKETKRDLGNVFEAVYSPGHLRFNLHVLGKEFFDKADSRLGDVLDLVIHELGHHFESNHLSREYYRALSKLGAGMTELALKNPDIFRLEE